MNNFKKLFLPACILIFLTLLYFYKGLLDTSNYFIGGIDVCRQFYWVQEYIVDRLSSFSLPLWTPYFYSGHPFLANPQTAVFYPATLIFLIFPLPLAFTINAVLHIFIAALGMYLYVMKISFSRVASLGAGIIFGFSGYFINRIYMGHTPYFYAAALIPWVIYCYEIGIQSQKLKYFLLTGGVLALLLLAGDGQNALYLSLFLGAYTLLQAYFKTREDLIRRKTCGNLKLALTFAVKQLGIGLVQIGLVILTALLLSAIQLLPTLEFLQLSDRAEPSLQFSTFLQFPLINFTTFLVPDIKSSLISTDLEFTSYVGILALIFVGTGIILSKQRRHVIILSIISLLAVTVMLGNQTPLFALYYHFIPGIKAFRVPARCATILIFCLAALAGVGIKEFFSEKMEGRRYTMFMFFIFVCFLTLLLINFNLAGKAWSEEVNNAFILLGLCLLLFFFSWASKNTPYPKILALSILFFDLFLNFQHNIPITNVKQLTRLSPTEQYVLNDPELFRVWLPFMAPRAVKFHYYTVDAYNPLVLDGYFRFMHEMAGVYADKLFRQKLNKRILNENTDFMAKFLNVKYVRDFSGEKTIVQKVYYPRAFLVDNATVVTNLDQQLDLLKKNKVDIRKTILINKTPNTPEEFLFSTGKDNSFQGVKINKYKAEKIELEVCTDVEKYLFLSELFYPGWKATINGLDTEIVKGNYIFRSIFVPAGCHKIIFSFHPNSLYVGAFISLLTFIAICSYFLYTYYFIRN